MIDRTWRVLVALVGILLAGCVVVGSDEPARPGHAQSAGPAGRLSVAAGDAGVPSGAERVTIDHVVDGDTVVVSPVGPGSLVRGETTVRLLEIDAPESKDRRRPVQCFARLATQALQRLLPVGSEAKVVADRDPTDRYGRALLYLWNAEDVFVNARLVGRGFARAVLFRPNDRYIDLMRAAERRARRDGRGLWGACGYFGQPAS